MAKKPAVPHQVRQGDVLLEAATKPRTARKQTLSAPHFIVKRGESSGHAHVLDSSDIVLWLDEDGQQFLEVINQTMVMHILEGSRTPTEDHAFAPLKPGIYRLPEQVEFDDDDMRAVAD